MRHSKIAEIAPVLGLAADLHVAQHDAAQTKVAQFLEELARAWEQRDAWRSWRTQGTSNSNEVCVPTRDAEALEGSAEDSVGSLGQAAVVLAQRCAKCGQRLCGLERWQKAG